MEQKHRGSARTRAHEWEVVLTHSCASTLLSCLVDQSTSWRVCCSVPNCFTGFRRALGRVGYGGCCWVRQIGSGETEQPLCFTLLKLFTTTAEALPGDRNALFDLLKITTGWPACKHISFAMSSPLKLFIQLRFDLVTRLMGMDTA